IGVTSKPRTSSKISARFSRCAGGLGNVGARERHVSQQRGDRFFPGPPEAVLHRRLSRDAQRPALSVLGFTHRGFANRRESKRGKARGRLLQGALRRSAAAAWLPSLYERTERGRSAGDRRQISVEGLQHLR